MTMLMAKLRNILKDVLGSVALRALPILLLSSCGNDPLAVDVSGVKTNPVIINRFEQELFALRAVTIESELPLLQKKYPHFTEPFLRTLLCTTGLQDSACLPEIIRFISDKDMKEAYELTQKHFADMSSFSEQADGLIKHMRYYFPNKPQPDLFTMMSGFNYAIANVDSGFGIGLEMYLGPSCKFYEMLQVPLYKKRTMQPEYLARDLAMAWVMRDFPNKSKGKTLLSEMIYQGRLLYFINALLPQAHDTLLIGFTKKQLDWCREYEKDVWGHILQNKFLYSSEADAISKFTGEGPFTTGFVKESPARTGIWLGWNIVRAYMKEYPKTSLEELMKLEDPQIILSKSKYKP